MNPYLIIGLILALAGVYGYAHHAGYAERDAEMQQEIALRNEEARAKEQGKSIVPPRVFRIGAQINF